MEMNESAHIHIDRKVYTQKELDDAFGLIAKKKKSKYQHCSELCSAHCLCTRKCVTEMMIKFLPFVDMVRTYKKKYIVADILSGLSVGIIHIPQGMGFALLTGVPAYFGLYTSFWPVLFYIFLGTSRHLSLGTMALVSLLIGSVVEKEIEIYKENYGNTTSGGTSVPRPSEEEVNLQRASIACAVSFLIGVMQVAMGLLRLGIITRVMSTSFISGFSTGAAIHIATSQLKFLLGIQVKRHDGLFKIPLTWYEVCKNIAETNAAEIIIGIVCILILYILKEIINEKFKKKLPVPIPAELLVLIAATALSHYLNFSERYDVKTIGFIPEGFPAPAVPDFHNMQKYVVDAFIAAILSFVFSAVMCKIFARKYRYEIDPNQEMFAYGVSHSISSFLWSFAGAAAPSRCFVQDSTGGKTQAASLISCILLLLVILFLGPLLESLPNSVLAAVIFVAIMPLYKQVRDIKSSWKLNKVDCAIWLVSFVSTVFLDVSYGLAIGIFFSILTIVLQGCIVKAYTVATKHNTGLYVSSDSYHNTHMLDDIMVFKYESNLYFTTAPHFKEVLQKAFQKRRLSFAHNMRNNIANGSLDHQTAMQTDSLDNNNNNLRVIVLDCSAMIYVDIMGLDAIAQMHGDFQNLDVELVLAGCNRSLIHKLHQKGLYGHEESKLKIYIGVHDAVVACSNIAESSVL